MSDRSLDELMSVDPPVFDMDDVQAIAYHHITERIEADAPALRSLAFAMLVVDEAACSADENNDPGAQKFNRDVADLTQLLGRFLSAQRHSDAVGLAAVLQLTTAIAEAYRGDYVANNQRMRLYSF